MKQFVCSTIAALIVIGLSQTCEAQMEKRVNALYRLNAFLKSAPQIGAAAPELELKTIDGEDADLSQYLGKPLVLVKGSYT